MNVALYARVSTVRQAEADLSIPDQLTQMRAWCRENGHTVVAEYVEPGASGTDDRRPVFQKMMDAATTKPYPYEAIIVHSHSRFFRNARLYVFYDLKLERAGTRVISITQPTGDNPEGELVRYILTFADQQNSAENSKHTSRAMRENARRGFFNGSRPPFGYKAVETEVVGHKGRKRRRLEIDEREALVVKKIYDLYLHGQEGNPMGLKTIVKHLNEAGILMRGRPWQIQKLNAVLADDTYRGEFRFNMRDSRTGQLRPESEWIRTPVAPIVDEATFDAARRIREARDPHKKGGTAQHVTSPTLLAGLIKCDGCNISMTQASGKGGKYRYYKCTHKMVKAADCTTPNLPLSQMDKLVLSHLVDKVLTPQRVTAILKIWLTKQARKASATEGTVQQLEKARKKADDGLNNLYKGVEEGILSLDSMLQSRVNRLKDERERILQEIALAKRELPSPKRVSPKQVEYVCARMREMLLNPELGFSKQLLRMLVTEIRVRPGVAELSGSAAALEATISGLQAEAGIQVPSLIRDWRARQESNLYQELRKLSFYPLNYGRRGRYCSVFTKGVRAGPAGMRPAGPAARPPRRRRG